MEHDGCKGCKQNAVDKYVKKTNIDRVREMSAEELAKFIYDFEFHEGNCQFPDRYDDKKEKSGGCLGECYECLKEWLESECDAE